MTKVKYIIISNFGLACEAESDAECIEQVKNIMLEDRRSGLDDPEDRITVYEVKREVDFSVTVELDKKEK
jgi:hypothetical protein